MKIRLNSTKQTLILLSLLIVVLFGLHFLAFRFIWSAGLEVSALEANVNVLNAQVLEFSKYKPEGIRDLARAVTSRIISRTNIADFIQVIENKAKAQNLAIEIRSAKVEPRDVDNPEDYLEIARLRIETRGSWANTMRFVKYLEHLPYKVSLHALNLSTIVGDGTEKVPEWRGEVEITALKFKQLNSSN